MGDGGWERLLARPAGWKLRVHPSTYRIVAVVQVRPAVHDGSPNCTVRLETLMIQDGPTLRWIPAHVGVPGNEAADGKAKCAALVSAGGATGGGPGTDHPIIRLAAAAKRMVRERIQDRWRKQWESERTAQPTKRLVEWPSKKTLRLYECLSKPRSSIMIQMRSMRIALRYFLYKINEVDSDKCPCGEGSSQAPRHVLLQCQMYGA
jgi:hypothetical protein